MFVQRSADVMLSVAMHLAVCPGGFICWSYFELFGLKDYVLHHILALEKICHLQVSLSSQASVAIVTSKRRTRHLQVTDKIKG